MFARFDKPFSFEDPNASAGKKKADVMESVRLSEEQKAVAAHMHHALQPPDEGHPEPKPQSLFKCLKDAVLGASNTKQRAEQEDLSSRSPSHPSLPELVPGTDSNHNSQTELPLMVDLVALDIWMI